MNAPRLLSPLLLLSLSLGLACGDADAPGEDAGLADTGAPPPECARDEDCEEGESCAAGRCEPKSCTTHEECGELYCVAATCQAAPSCEGGAACPTGLTCSPTEELCLETTPCAMDADCPVSGQLCVSGVCAARRSCTASSECPGALRCREGTCRDPCQQAADCGNAVLYTCEAGECLQNCLGDTNCAEHFICEERSGAASVCVPAACRSNPDCGGSGQECYGLPHGRCRPITQCSESTPCPSGFFCNASDICEELPTCRRDGDCAGPAYCQDGRCQPSASCGSMSCGEGLECVNEVCVPFVCRTSDDCESDEVCVSGACGPAPSAALVTEVRILSPGAVLSPGTTARMFAVALDSAGRPVPGVTLEWQSGVAAVATVDPHGLVTGGDTAGTSSVTARLNNGSQDVVSSPVSVTNVGPAPKGRRVTVVNARTGAPIEGATVVLEPSAGPAQSASTDAQGVVLAGNVAPLARLSVFHADFDWLTVVGVSGPDLYLRLTPASRSDRAGGVKGAVDLSAITGTKPFEIGLSGGSFAGPLSRFQPGQLFGGSIFNVDLRLTTVALPSGATVRGAVSGFPITVKGEYQALTTAGPRFGWCFGGKVELADLGISLTGGGTGGFLPNLLNLFPQFASGVRGPAVTLSLPTVVDGADVDGDGDTQELVPDFANFTTVDHRPDAPQSLRYRYRAEASLPSSFDSVILVSGVIVPGAGFLPLGIDGMTSQAGVVSSLATALSPARGGTEGSVYAVLALGVNLASGLPTITSAQLHLAERLPAEVDGSAGWLELATGAWDEGTRTVTSSVPAGADAWRARFQHDEGLWEVWAAGAVETLQLPAAVGTDRSQDAGLMLEAVDLAGSGELEALFDAQVATDELHLDRQTRRFSQNPLRTR